ncbi:hypothetical protein BC830DRAFT_772679 [Chytriomyces sp. MP71]|nr:hypothetical protein BC830DRAFT_772679 [Chytriomyces sp. MP71]
MESEYIVRGGEDGTRQYVNELFNGIFLSARTLFLTVRPTASTHPRSHCMRMSMLATGQRMEWRPRQKAASLDSSLLPKPCSPCNGMGPSSFCKTQRQLELSSRNDAAQITPEINPPRWTRVEFLQVRQTTADMKRLASFLHLILLIPKSPSPACSALVGSTCVSPDQHQAARGWLRTWTSMPS